MQLGYSLSKKFNDKWLLFSNPMKLWLLGYFCMQNSFLHREYVPKSMVFEKYAKNGKKNIQR